MFSEEMEVASPPWGSHPHGVKGLWALGGLTVSTVAGHRTGHKPYAKRWVEAVVKPREDGAYAHQHLNFIPFGKVHGRKAKASNRTTGNPAVRHYRGATGNVSHGGIVNPSCIERAGMETPHLKRGAPVLYPNSKQREFGNNETDLGETVEVMKLEPVPVDAHYSSMRS